MTGLRCRPYAGAADLLRMQDLLAAAYPHTWHRVGDLAWLSREHTHRELSLYVRLWEADGEVVGWAFLRATGGFLVFAAPNWAGDLYAELVTVVEEMAEASVTAGDTATDLHTYGVDESRLADAILAAVLRQHGFTGRGSGGVLVRRLDDIDPPEPPAGYRLAPVDTRDRLTGRVETHRLVFAPSELTVRKYGRLTRAWPYRPELDRIAVAGDGCVAAFCTAWLDERNGAGLLEPVGTHPGHRRRGLARAVCLDALRALRAAGAGVVQVGYATAAARRTYESIGFRYAGADTRFSKSTVDRR